MEALKKKIIIIIKRKQTKNLHSTKYNKPITTKRTNKKTIQLRVWLLNTIFYATNIYIYIYYNFQRVLIRFTTTILDHQNTHIIRSTRSEQNPIILMFFPNSSYKSLYNVLLLKLVILSSISNDVTIIYELRRTVVNMLCLF